MEATDKAAATRGALDKMDSLWLLLSDCLSNSVSETRRNPPKSELNNWTINIMVGLSAQK